jgi:hypothetical protein
VRSSFFGLFLTVVAGCGVASGQTTYGGGAGAVVKTDACTGDPSKPCVASPYPSTITVPGGAATVNFSAPFSVKISGIQAPSSTNGDGPCYRNGRTGVPA